MENSGEAVRWGTGELERAGVGSAQLTAQLLLGYVLGRDRVGVIAHAEDLLSAASADSFISMIRRRVGGEPLQYILGVQEFYGRPFEVTPEVLIPRPETEILVERAVALSSGWAAGGRPLVVDVGTGSGCIAVTVACECPGARLVATEVSTGALAVACRNADRHAARDRVAFVAGDLLGAFPARPVFDLVLSNPPYVALSDAGSLARTVHAYEPHSALFAGESGLQAFERLVPQARERLVPGGWLLMELGAGQAPSVREIVSRHGLEVVDTLADLQGIARCLVARRGNG